VENIVFRALLVAATAAVAAFTVAPVTRADPDPDPHIPNMAANYCPNGGPKWLFASTYCDGMPYADGSYWHIVKRSYFSGIDDYTPDTSPMRCVVDPDGAPVPQPAPPGGCEGAVQ
jgi:hypothetical protein